MSFYFDKVWSPGKTKMNYFAFLEMKPGIFEVKSAGA